MTEPSAIPLKSPNASIAPPLLLWLLLQITALTLAAAHVPFAANFVVPREKLAAHEMLVAQFVASAMLFPFSLRDSRACTALILTSAPMLQLAGMLSVIPIGNLAAAWTCLAVWLAALTLWNRATPPRWRGFAIACASFLAIGGLALWYLGAEFGTNPTWPRAFPLDGAIHLLTHSDIFLPFLSTALFAVFPAVFLTLRRD